MPQLMRAVILLCDLIHLVMTFFGARQCIILFASTLCLQHVLILVKLILTVVIPDEPDWIRKKREHIEYTSMQALKQQVTFPPRSIVLLSIMVFLIYLFDTCFPPYRGFLQGSPDVSRLFWHRFICCCVELLQYSPQPWCCVDQTGVKPWVCDWAHTELCFAPESSLSPCNT